MLHPFRELAQMTPAILTELKRLEKAGTLPPWKALSNGTIEDTRGHVLATVETTPMLDDRSLFQRRQDQTQLIVAMRNSLPTLIEAVETMHAALEKVITVDGHEALYPIGPGIAREALARVAALLGEGRGK